MISVSLEDVRDSRQIWGEHINRKLSNLVSCNRKSRLTYTAAASKLEGEGENYWPKRPTENVEAYQLYLQGLSIGTSGPKRISRRHGLFHQAVQKDRGTHCLMQALRTHTACSAIAGYLPPSEAWPKAKAAAMQSAGNR